MSRLAMSLKVERAAGRKSVVPFITGGYPDRETFVRLALAAQHTGCGALEVGIPFSDPSADGPVIQRASNLMLSQGVGVREVLRLVSLARERGLAIPIVLMSYLNPLLAYDFASFAEDAAQAGADAVLMVDVAEEEADELRRELLAAGLHAIGMVAPTTPAGRLQRIANNCSGFVYCVSTAGITGEGRPDLSSTRRMVRAIHACCDQPALVGFGIDGPRIAAELCRFADGVIVGSELLRRVDAAAASLSNQELAREARSAEVARSAGEFLRSLTEAVNTLGTLPDRV